MHTMLTVVIERSVGFLFFSDVDLRRTYYTAGSKIADACDCRKREGGTRRDWKLYSSK